MKGTGALLGATALVAAAAGVWLSATPYDSGRAPWESETPTPEPTPVALPTYRPTVAPSVEPTTSTPERLDGVTVVLDPGHNSDNAANVQTINAQVPDGRGGTKACNTVGTTNLSGYPEHDFTFDVADRARQLLEDEGATVVMTREATGVGPCVDARGQAAEESDADLFVSIHGNGSESAAPHGFFAMVVATPLHEPQGEPSRALAEDLVAALEPEGFTPSSWAGDIIERDDLATLNHSTRPAVMLELAEFRNPEESVAVEDPEVRARYAAAITEGIVAWTG